MEYVKDILNKIKPLSDMEDGTYDLATLSAVEYDNGYQVSFVRSEAYELVDEDWDFLVNYFVAYLESPVHIGVYNGEVEVSFRAKDRNKALSIMEEYNQESVLDWEKKKNNPNDIESWFIFNRRYDRNYKVNYSEIIRQIQLHNASL